METPSEWAKRFNPQKTGEMADAPKPEATVVDSPAAVAEFPNEPFLCPACGQLLGPSCRVCVACKHPINPAEIARTPAVALAAAHAVTTQPRPEPVRYPWRILIAVMGIGMILGLISLALLGDQKGPLVIQAIPILAGLWVFFDAFRRRLPRPLRWGVGTMLLLAVVFPWYLARRSKPESPVPFVEAETGPVTRILLIALLVFFLIGLIFNIVQGPPPASKPASRPTIQENSGSSPSRITSLRPRTMYGRLPQASRIIPSPTVSSRYATLPIARVQMGYLLELRKTWS
jgi:hypothetical protein